jgi:hypothetical protein
MPNYCYNRLTLRHADPALINRAATAFKAGKLLDEFVPVPQELRDTVSGSYAAGYARELHEFQQNLNIKYFGFRNWYHFCCANWGTKWEVSGEVISEEPNLLVVEFESAWSPPLEFYGTIQNLGFEVTAYYWEPGMAFAGRFDQDGDEFFQIKSLEDAKNLPTDIDEAMEIYASMLEWEEA